MRVVILAGKSRELRLKQKEKAPQEKINQSCPTVESLQRKAETANFILDCVFRHRSGGLKHAVTCRIGTDTAVR